MKDGQQGSIGKGKGKAGKANGAAAPATPALTGKEKAQAIIDAAFAEVKQDMARKANAGQLSFGFLATSHICKTIRLNI
jgi:hypothetical protein